MAAVREIVVRLEVVGTDEMSTRLEQAWQHCIEMVPQQWGEYLQMIAAGEGTQAAQIKVMSEVSDDNKQSDY